MDIDTEDRSYQSILSQDSAIGLIMAQGEDSSTKFIVSIESTITYIVVPHMYHLLLCMCRQSGEHSVLFYQEYKAVLLSRWRLHVG